MANSCWLSRARGGGDDRSLTPGCSATVIRCISSAWLDRHLAKTCRVGKIIHSSLYVINPSEFIAKQSSVSARLVFKTRAKCQDFVARYKVDGISNEIDSPFCVNTTPQMTLFRGAKACSKWLQERSDDLNIQSDNKYKSGLKVRIQYWYVMLAW